MASGVASAASNDADTTMCEACNGNTAVVRNRSGVNGITHHSPDGLKGRSYHRCNFFTTNNGILRESDSSVTVLLAGLRFGTFRCTRSKFK